MLNQVVLLRSGVLLHVKKYMQTLGLLPLDAPVKPEAHEDAEEAPAEGEDQSGEAGMPQTSRSDHIISCLFKPQCAEQTLFLHWLYWLGNTPHAGMDE